MLVDRRHLRMDRGKKGATAAYRTTDPVAIIKAEFDAQPQGLKFTGGDVHGTTHAFTTLRQILDEGGWTDVGRSL